MKGWGLRKADWLLGLTGAYCAISVMMNLLCTKPMSFGTGFVWMDGGLLISWIVFMISNVVTEVYGKRQAIIMAGVATIVAFFVNVVAALEVHLPTLPEYAGQADHFAHIFSNGPRTILSSAIAFFIGNAVNCEIIDRFRRRAEEERNDNGWRFTFRAVFPRSSDSFLTTAYSRCLPSPRSESPCLRSAGLTSPRPWRPARSSKRRSSRALWG